MAKSKEPVSTMESIGMDMSDFYDTDLIKPTKTKGTRKSSTKKTSFLKHTTKDNRKNVT
jgi:hypothetical protein